MYAFDPALIGASSKGNLLLKKIGPTVIFSIAGSVIFDHVFSLFMSNPVAFLIAL